MNFRRHDEFFPGPLGLSLALSLAVISQNWAQDSAAQERAFFETHVRPVLVEHCATCHATSAPEGGLSLLTRESALQGGDHGPALVAGDPDASRLIQAVEHMGELQMPPDGKLSDKQIQRLRTWVLQGAYWPTNSPLITSGNASGGFQATEKQQQWWAFQPLRQVTAPQVKNTHWPRQPVDQFVLAKMESLGLTPSPPASRRTWLRRVTFDLVGLPPTPEELGAFEADASDQAFERVVDQLLSSPAYGERWARHWLDVVRYADYHDGEPTARVAVCEPLEAWRYRDWIVNAFNRDMPFDQLIIHQIAGDLLPSADDTEPYEDGLIATTFLVNGAWDRGDADKEKMVSDMVDDQIDTVGKAFLGLTLGCSRCHDHKFDPISQADYYGLAGIFYSTRMLKELGEKGGEITLQRRPLVPEPLVAHRERHVRLLAEVEAQLVALDKQTPPPSANDPARVAIVARRDQLRETLPPEPPMALAVSEGGVPGGLFPDIQDVPIHIRGSYTRLGDVVPRRMPTFFAGVEQAPITPGSGRRELANWIASSDNPLTPRVIVNRVWHWHFGEGLVRTPNNLGLLSEPPSHPELLDWLATSFVQKNWSLKELHRILVLSATYRQASDAPLASVAELDSENRWLSRFVPRRLESEPIRDAMLSVTGKLQLQMGGPASHDLAIPRRTLYLQTARWDRSNFASLFDAANPDASTEKRNVSTVALQSLFLMNHPFVLMQARNFGERLQHELPDRGADAEAARIQRAYLLALQRLPSDEELAIARELVAGSQWHDLAHVLLCSNEFIYID